MYCFVCGKKCIKRADHEKLTVPESYIWSWDLFNNEEDFNLWHCGYCNSYFVVKEWESDRLLTNSEYKELTGEDLTETDKDPALDALFKSEKKVWKRMQVQEKEEVQQKHETVWDSKAGVEPTGSDTDKDNSGNDFTGTLV